MFQDFSSQRADCDELHSDEGWWDSLLGDEEKDGVEDDNQVSLATNKGNQDHTDWSYLESIYHDDAIIELDVNGYNRGGLLVQGENVQGFVPISHLVIAPSSLEDEDRKQFLMDYVGKKLPLKIIEFVPEEERVVFSERAAQAGEGKRKLIFAQIKPGDIVNGTVTNVTEFGAFLDLGGLEGLIHVSELSWGRVEHPGDILCVGQQIDALVLNVSEQTARIALSYKRLDNNPWESITEVYVPGDVVTAKISGLTKFGAFARLKEGVEGLIHVSTIQFPPGKKDIGEILHKGDCVSVKILHIDSEKKRIGLCLESD
jgi:small subunit ribosomal protein S1